ncbi:unnamed protein product [Staurois parvus]|uniref:Secreted protein n=1 Tax=Staurois parvus TaxID=386267 RepID=A0ABN9FL23_9NEOB|nr:unnamed protein product [Staurois parvus]
MARQEQCRSWWLFRNVLLHSLPVLASWESAAPRTNRCTGPLCEVPIHVITDWPISDHMNSSSKQDVTC